MESGSIYLKKNVLRFMMGKGCISNCRSMDLDANNIEPERSWMRSDEQRCGLNVFGQPRWHQSGNVAGQCCEMSDA